MNMDWRNGFLGETISGAPPRGPKELFLSQNRAKIGFPSFKHRIMIAWRLTKFEMINIDWRNMFRGKTLSGAPCQGPYRAIFKKIGQKLYFLSLCTEK